MMNLISYTASNVAFEEHIFNACLHKFGVILYYPWMAAIFDNWQRVRNDFEQPVVSNRKRERERERGARALQRLPLTVAKLLM